MFQKIRVIINPASGQDRPILSILNRAFQPAGVDWEVCITKKAGDARRYAQESAAAGVEAVGVYGGDGTVMEVASGLMGTELPMAIFPGGTANVMAIELGIPSDTAEACALVCSDESITRIIDMGKANEHNFMLRVGVGFEADMVEGAQREMKNRFGTLAYMISALQALSSPTIAKYHLTIDGKLIETEGMTCVIANTGSMGIPGLNLAQNIDVGDGLLDVVVIRSAELSSLLSVAASMVAGNEDAAPLLHWQGREISLIADPPQTVQVDGEVLGKTNINVKVVPQALKIIVPKTPTTLQAAQRSDEALNQSLQQFRTAASTGR